MSEQYSFALTPEEESVWKDWSDFLEKIAPIASFIFLVDLSQNVYLTIASEFEANLYSAEIIFNKVLFICQMSAESSGVVLVTFVGNFLGSGNYLRAKNFSHIGIAFNFVGMVLFQLGFYLKLDQISQFLSPNEITSELFILLFPLYGVNCFLVTNCLAVSSVLRACGYEKIINATIILTQMFLGLPLSLLLSFKFHFGFIGLIYGRIFVNLIALIIYVIAYVQIDWERQALQITDQLQKANNHILVIQKQCQIDNEPTDGYLVEMTTTL